MRRDRALFGVTNSRLRASLQRAPHAHRGAGDEFLGEDVALELACRQVVAQLCSELSCGSAHELVASVKSMHTLALTVPKFEVFAEEMGTILRDMRRRASEAPADEQGATSVAGRPVAESAHDLNDLCRGYRAFARDFNVAKLLLSGPATLAHRILLFFQRLTGAESLRDVTARMEDMQQWVRGTRVFIDDVRSVFGVSPLCSTSELLAIIRAYVTTFGLPPRGGRVL